MIERMTVLSRWLVAGVLTLGAVAAPVAADEGRPLIREVRFGVLAHDIPGIWSGFRLETTAPDVNGEIHFRPSVALFGGTLRPVLGGTANFNGGTSKVYVDARWEIEARNGFFFGLGLGIAAHNGWNDATSLDHKALGARALLHFPFEIGYRFQERHSISVYFEHFSNGYSHKYNEGIDGLGMRYGYRF
jgi:lipid A 3-O-deacylase